MHITLIVPAPFDLVSGGYAYDRRMLEGLRARGHEVSVVELSGRFPATDDIARDSACIAWDRLPPHTRPLIDGLAMPAFAGLEDALLSGGAIGLIHHPTALETGLDESLRETLRVSERRLYAHLRFLIANSEPTAARLVNEFGVDSARIAVVVPGTDDAPRSRRSGGKTCEILSIGNIVPRKGHNVLMRALARLFDLDWRLTIAGSLSQDPSHARALAALAQRLNIARHVRFVDEVTGAALEELWQASDVFALASHFESYGMAIAEALKRGLPVAVTSGAAVASVITPEAGVVCEPGDWEQLSKALRRLVFSPALRQHMAEAAWQVGQSLPDWEMQAALFAEALRGEN